MEPFELKPSRVEVQIRFSDTDNSRSRTVPYSAVVSPNPSSSLPISMEWGSLSETSHW